MPKFQRSTIVNYILKYYKQTLIKGQKRSNTNYWMQLYNKCSDYWLNDIVWGFYRFIIVSFIVS